MKPHSLPILEEFLTIQGEGINLGVPYYFIRVGGCPLRCNFCDSEYTWTPKKESIKPVSKVIHDARKVCFERNISWVSITGGEPLLYPEQILEIAESLQRDGIKVQIETSGRFHDWKVHRSCDIYSVDAKTPCTGEVMHQGFLGIEEIRDCDQVKCLIFNDTDMQWAWDLNKRLDGRCLMVLQPFNMEIVTDSIENMSPEMADMRPAYHGSISSLRNRLLAGYRNLVEVFYGRVKRGQVWKNVMISPQIHVLAWGNVSNR